MVDSAIPVVRPETAQYSLRRILLIWLAATAPMGLLAWVVWPALRVRVPMHPGMLFWFLMILGMVWQCVLSLLVLRRELGTLRWSTLAPRIWAQHPRDPETGRVRVRLWWVLVPLIAAFGVITLLADWLGPFLGGRWLTAPQGTDVRQLADPQFAGQWWILAVAVVSSVFNYLLGEELLFRGVLLPRMRGVFGRADWFVNNVLFTLYHVHKFWVLPSVFLTSLPFSWAAARYRTVWFSVVLHGIEGIVLLVMVTLVVGGLVG